MTVGRRYAFDRCDGGVKGRREKKGGPG